MPEFALLVLTSDPEGLRKSIQDDVADGEHDTWEWDAANKGLRHRATQLRENGKKAWVTFKVDKHGLWVNFIKEKGQTLASEFLAMHVGHFITLLVGAYLDRFSNVAVPGKQSN